MTAPIPGICIPVVIDDIHDGDTVKAHRPGSNIQINLRLLDCWAPEVSIRGIASDYPEHQKTRILTAGRSAKAGLEELISSAAQSHQEFRVQIPFSTMSEHGAGFLSLADLLTMGRVLGYLWVGDVNASEYLCQCGLAFRTKDELIKVGLA